MAKAGEGRRHVTISLPKKGDNLINYVKIDADEVKVYTSEDMNASSEVKGSVIIDVEIPQNIKTLTLRKTGLPPIIELGLNRKLWPIEQMVGLKLILDNRNISMIENGQFRETKYKQLCNALTWKKWALLVYEKENGDLESTLFWKP